MIDNKILFLFSYVFDYRFLTDFIKQIDYNNFFNFSHL